MTAPTLTPEQVEEGRRLHEKYQNVGATNGGTGLSLNEGYLTNWLIECAPAIFATLDAQRERIKELERERDEARGRVFNALEIYEGIAKDHRIRAEHAEAERDAAIRRAEAMRAAIVEWKECEAMMRRDGCPDDRWQAANAAIDAAIASEQPKANLD